MMVGFQIVYKFAFDVFFTINIGNNVIIYFWKKSLW